MTAEPFGPLFWLSVLLWFFIGGIMLWNTLFRTYAIGTYRWMTEFTQPQLQDKKDWAEEYQTLRDEVMPIVDEYILESYGFILPLFIFLSINSALVIITAGGLPPNNFLLLLMATGNAAAVVSAMVLRKRYYEIKAMVEACKTVLAAVSIHNGYKEEEDNTLE